MIEEYKKCAGCGMQNQASMLTSRGLCLHCAWREWKRERKQVQRQDSDKNAAGKE